MSAYFIPAAQIILAIAMLVVALLCIRLDRKITALREGKDGVAAAAKELALAVGRAEASVATLKASSQEAQTHLERGIQEARAAADTLKFLSSTARALEGKSAPSRVDREAQHDLRWNDDPLDDEFRLKRRDRPTSEKWGGLR
ncbi:DUF6468 domain-containing protein [Candidatus Phycosocius spiralis]|uniref:DUF6468 domain-containing protein n=1 Tax=Candidatus Phycosocius spiralis TaxID=2815099 RepID=A0ABQ4PWX2_9PROT|nr:DUF6468 domain-containing protein [Candidatus Phycosocius spiralis]GIU67441.1 hypothetical protein PsB1_1595 [Candidatus Phycosocius spiralis]